MAKIGTTVKIDFTAQITLTAVELAALDALVGYGDDAFIKAFKEKLGAAYLENHESGLRSFFEAIRVQALPELHAIRQAERDLYEAARAREADRRKGVAA